jgi:uncharacterized protein YacL
MSMRGIVARLALTGIVALVAAAAAAAGRSTIAGALAGAALGGGVVLLERAADRVRIDRLFWAVAGGVVGLVAGLVAGRAAGGVTPASGTELLALGAVLGAWLGAAVGLRRGPDVAGLNAALFARLPVDGALKLVDTSAIIDGRIADLAATGFIDGPLVIPQFVLRELQQIADSTDPRRRARGQRGFDVVQRLQRGPRPVAVVDDSDVPGVGEVDEKLLELAKTRGARVITTDYNLNKRAEVSGVAVLNVNELANALKPAALAGEALRVHVVREGKEPGQGVAYLDDGTMVVVDQGKRWIGQSVDVAVTSVLQTPAGRIIFTRRREEEPARA